MYTINLQIKLVQWIMILKIRTQW